MKQPICVYVDNSNIFHEGQRLAAEAHNEDRFRFRLHFDNFLNLATQSGPIAEIVWGGSIPPPTDSVWVTLKAKRIEPVLIPRATSGENETVDNAIQLHMYRHVRKYRASPGTIALATGDGAGYFKDQGFLYDAEGFVSDGWHLHLLSWKHSCHKKLREFAEKNGAFTALDDHYHHITFIKNGRRVAG